MEILKIVTIALIAVACGLYIVSTINYGSRTRNPEITIPKKTISPPRPVPPPPKHE